MFRFSREQTVCNIAGVRIGGQPGENPAALAGTIFYHGHRIVKDESAGTFDLSRAEALIAGQQEISDITGNPCLVHIFARTVQAFERYLDFVTSIYDGPVIADSPESQVRSGIARLISETGFADRVIYNSISVATTPEEEVALSDSEVDCAILLAYNPTDSTVEGGIKVLIDGMPGRRGLIALSKEIGITNLLIDPGVRPLGDGAGSSLRFVAVAKASLGLPVGSGMHNAASSWPWLKSRSHDVRLCCDAAASAFVQMAGGDFILYGPIENARAVFPAAAMADILITEAVKDLDVISHHSHPIYRLL